MPSDWQWERGLSPGSHVRGLNLEPGLWRRHGTRKMSSRNVIEDAVEVQAAFWGDGDCLSVPVSSDLLRLCIEQRRLNLKVYGLIGPMSDEQRMSDSDVDLLG